LQNYEELDEVLGARMKAEVNEDQQLLLHHREVLVLIERDIEDRNLSEENAARLAKDREAVVRLG
jgi:hypothetical protein